MNQKGFSLISLVAFLPFLIAFVFGLTELCLFLKFRTTTHHICRSELLAIQREMKRSLLELLSLNPQATYLRNEEKRIKAKMIAAAGVPQILALLRMKLAANQFEQSLLRTKQLSILSSTQVQANHKLAQLKKHLELDTTQSTVPRLAVRADPPNAIAPNYETVERFEHAQSITVTWRQNTYKGTCSATISKKTGGQWTEKLGTASL